MQTGELLPGAQQLDKLATAVANGSGAATFTYERPPPNLWWSGSLNCAGAPNGAIFTAQIDATPWGTWGGPTVFGPVQAQGGQQLSVTAVGLNPGQQYALAWLGSSDPTGTVQPLAPDANASALLAATTQGSFDLIATNNLGAPQSFPHDTWTQLGPFTALHSYNSLVFVILDQSGGTACPVTFVAAVNDTHGFVPYEAQASPFELRFGAATNPSVTFVLPFASSPGDNVFVEVDPLGTTMADTVWFLFGATSPIAVSVTNPLGNPLAVAPRGGLSIASHTFAGAGSFTILGAPASGISYRLQRLTVTGPNNITLTGLSTGALYGVCPGTNNQQVDNLEGLLTTGEALSVTTGAACSAYLFYDTIPTPAIS